MADRSYSNADIKYCVEEEGLDYTLLHYLDPHKIDDKELRDLCVTAMEALQKVEEFLEGVEDDIEEEGEDDEG